MIRPTRLLLVDEHPIFCASLQAYLSHEPSIQVIGRAHTAAAAAQQSRKLRPDIVVMDPELPGATPLHAIRLVRTARRRTRILILGERPEGPTAIACVEAGADGYLPKTAPEQQLLAAIRRVAAGEMYLCPSSAKMLAGLRSEQMVIRRQFDLSVREWQIIALTAAGYSAKEMAPDIGISPRFVEKLRAELMHKLGIRGRAELVRLALERRILRLVP